MAYPILTGFGSNPDDLNTMRLFHVEAANDGMYGDWQSEPLDAIHQIATTNQYDVHVMGYGPAILTLRLEFDTRADFEAFRALLHTEAVLHLISGFTHHSATVKHVNGRDYAWYTNTLLSRISDIRHTIGGPVECTATFMREETLT